MKFLCQRGHKRNYVKTQMNKAFNVPRKNTLYYHQHKKSNNPTVFVTTYDPSLPNFNDIIKNITPFLQPLIAAKNSFKDPPLLAYHRPRNLHDTLVRAKVKAPKTLPSPPKITPCNDGPCNTCNFIAHNTTTSYTFQNTRQTRTIRRNLSCFSDNLVQLINSKRCLKKPQLENA